MAAPTGIELEKRRSPGSRATPDGGRERRVRGPGRRAATGRIPRGERILASLLIAAALVARGIAVLWHRVNSDEPQHLHVAWGWTQGLLPYRDVFDNHSPLFSLLMSWPLRALGERPDIVVQMRFWMLPFAIGSLVLTGIIARRLFGSRVALWSVALLGAQSDFLLGSVEYRTDVAWACAWLGTLAVLVCGRMSRRRAFAAGLVAGIALAISMKTSLLVTAAAAAAVLTWFASRKNERQYPERAAGLVVAAAAGFVIVPLAVVAAFARVGALEAMIRCTVGYNVVPGLGLWGRAPLRPLGFLVALPAVGAVVWWMRRNEREPDVAVRMAVLFAATAFADLAIETLWPLVVRGDMLPLRPVEAMFLAVVLATALPKVAGVMPALRAPVSRAVLAIATIVELALSIQIGDLGHDCSRSQRRALAEILNLTRPGDLVMSVKGEAVFRRRPVYTAIETIAEERYRQGQLVDDIPDRLAATGTAVVMQYDSRPYPPRAWAFIRANYLPLGDTRVLGQYLDPAGSGADERRFTIAVPQVYALFGLDGAPRGLLDGEPWHGPRSLMAGRHVYVAATGEGRLALAWAPAVERGFAPALLPAPPLELDAHDRLLVLAPHPDDEIVCNAGLMQAARAAGAAIRIVWATDGEANPWAQLAHEGRWAMSAEDHARWGALRRGESRRALQVLGVQEAGRTWLGLPDGGLTRLWMAGDRRLADSLVSAMQEFHPTIVSAPSVFDGHPDHSSMGVAANVALAKLPDATRPRLITYVAHHDDLAPGPTLRVSLTAAERERKLRAIECLSSQLHWRRRELTAFADTAEGFGPADSVVAGCQVQRVEGAWMEGDRLVIDFDSGRWPGLPPEVLRISSDGRSGQARYTVPLIARTGEAVMRDGSGLATAGRARFSNVGGHWRVTAPLGLAERPLSAFVKIERPTELAMGFFDESGWWPVATRRPRWW